MIITVGCLLGRCLPGCLMTLTRHQVSTDAGPLVLRHENTELRRQGGRVRYEPAAGRGWQPCRDWFRAAGGARCPR